MTTNTTSQAMRNIDATEDQEAISTNKPDTSYSGRITNQSSVLGAIARDQSISAPLVNEQQEFDIRIKSRNAEIERIRDEIVERNKRHAAHIEALTNEHDKEIERLTAVSDNIQRVVKILEAGNKMLFKDMGQ